ncbi:MAG: hypothetical protein EOM11_06695, partial [Erysipelotrichia bacterium]|nr:hypothetical protein [Erysipelotrichia bacterium]
MKTIIKICVVSRMFVCTFIDTFAQTKEVEIQDDEEVYVNSGIDTSPIEINHIKEKFKEKNRYVNPAKYLSITHQT